MGQTWSEQQYLEASVAEDGSGNGSTATARAAILLQEKDIIPEEGSSVDPISPNMLKEDDADLHGSAVLPSTSHQKDDNTVQEGHEASGISPDTEPPHQEESESVFCTGEEITRTISIITVQESHELLRNSGPPEQEESESVLSKSVGDGEGTYSVQETPHEDPEPLHQQQEGKSPSSANSAPPKIPRQERRAMARHKAPPLSVANVMTVLKDVIANYSWRDFAGKTLNISDYKLDAIEKDHSTKQERMKAAIQYWVLWDPLASWRRLAYQLYNTHQYREGEMVSSYAEKQRDPTFSFANVFAATHTLEEDHRSEDYADVEGGLNDCLRIPWLKLLTLQFHRIPTIKFYMRLSPYASWQSLYSEVLRHGNPEAAKKVEPYIRAEKDPTFTAAKLTQILEQVETEKLEDVCFTLGFSLTSSLSAQGVQAIADYYITNIKSASWHHVAIAFYDAKQHDSLEILREQVPSIKRSNESGRLFDEAMKLGHVDSRNSKIILYGAAGVGKTRTMDLLTGNDPATKRISTPVASRPVTMYQIDMKQRKWEKLPFKKKKEILAQVINARTKQQQKENESEDYGSNSEEDDFSDSDEVIRAETGAGAVSSKTPPTQTSSTQDISTQTHLVALKFKEASSIKKASPQNSQIINQLHASCGNLVELTVHCDSPKVPLTSLYRLYLVDSGGQPQFHEILPIFMRRMNLYIYVLKLSEELATKPMVEYYDSSGKPVGKPYQSYLSNKQLLRHCLRTLQSHRSSNKIKESLSSKVMIIGTHRDEEEKCQNETREAKNKKLANILLPTFKDEVIYFNMETQEFIFPVNAKDPQLEDRKLAEGVHDIILSKCCSDTIQLPLQYYGLEIVLEELSQVRGRGFLSKQECLEAAQELQFDKDSLDAALQFLDEFSVVFYFPELLENVVFTNSQVLLDKVTELVEALHSESTMCTGDWHKFKKHAIFTLEFLYQKEFVKHYLEGVFTAVELVKLFKGLFIIAEFSNTGSSPEYFMPALLPILEEMALSKYRVSPECPAAALALDFPHGGSRLGIFCSLTCFLVSPENHYPVPWKIKLQRNSIVPSCLTRNCIQFSIPHHPGTVTFIDTFTHFEAHFSIPAATAEMCPEMCSFIIQAITVGIRKASFTLGYKFSEPSLSLVCPCGKGDPHTASFRKHFWICSQDEDVAGKLESRHLMWQVKEKQNFEKASMEFNLKNINSALKELSPKKYLTLALELNLTKRSMEKHETNWPRDSDRVLTEIIQDWLDTDKSASWDTLKKALEEVQPALADTI